MSWKTAILLLAAVAPAACDSGEFNGPGQNEITGEYTVSAAKGEFIFTTDTDSWDLASEGSIVSLKVFANGTTSGRLYIPAATETAEDMEEDLSGRWMVQGNIIYFAQTHQNLIGAMEFERIGNELRAERQFIDGHVKLRLVKQ